MNSDSFKKSRLQSLNGEWPAACTRCKDDEAVGVESKRQFELKSYPDFTYEKAREITSDDGNIDDIQFDFIELRLGNVCNVKCIMCNPYSSSKWYNDFAELKKTLSWDIGRFELKDYQFKWPEREEIWADIFSHCKNIKTIYINGGEPTLNKQHRVFLKMLIDKGLTDIELRYNINLTGLPQDLIDIWKCFTNINIGCSIDDLADRNHYIRYPTEWTSVLENMDIIAAHGWNFTIAQTINWLNYYTVGDFYQFWEKKYGTAVIVIHNPVFFPHYLSPHLLPHEIRDRAHDRFATQLDSRKFDTLVKIFNKPFDAVGWEQAKEYIKAMDGIRNLNFLEHFPEFKGYF